MPSLQPDPIGREVRYRRATDSDREGIFRVLETANFHHIPSPEMPSIALEDFFVALVGHRIVGVAGFTILSDGRGKTTLMAVDPAFRRHEIGNRLQELRMLELSRLGCTKVVTNADLPEVVSWYKNYFGYEEVGKIRKLHSFGDDSMGEWTTLEADLIGWRDQRQVKTNESGSPRRSSRR